MPLLELTGLTIDYERAGTGRTTAMLVHGNYATRRWWQPILERVPSGLTIYAPTLRGFGRTRGARPARTVHELAQDLRELARGLALRRFHLVGHSLGGAVALQYALSWPETLTGVSLVAPAPNDGLASMRSRNDLLGHVMRWCDPGFVMSRLTLTTGIQLARMTGAYRPAIARALAQMMPSIDPAAIDFPALLDDAVAIDDQVLLDVYEALRKWDVAALLPRVQVPVRILAGRRDPLVALDSVEALARALPRARLDVWDDVGHSPQLECPTEFASWLAAAHETPFHRLRALVRRFIAQLRSRFGRRALRA